MWRPDSVFDATGHLDEGVVHAWLDDALDPAAAAAVRTHAAECATCAARVAEARGLIAGASRLLGALDAVPAVGPTEVAAHAPRAGIPAGAAAPAPAEPSGIAPIGRRRRPTRRFGLAAAAVLAFAVGSVVLRERFGDEESMRDAIGVSAEAPAIERSEQGYAYPRAAQESAAAPVPPPSGDAAGAAPEAPALTARAEKASSRAATGAVQSPPPAVAEPLAPSADAAPATIFAAPRAARPTAVPAPAPPVPARGGSIVARVPEAAGTRPVTSRRLDSSASVAERRATDSLAAHAARDSALARWRGRELRLDAVVATGAAGKAAAQARDSAAMARTLPPAAGGAWVVGCWQVGDTESLLEFTSASMGAPVATLAEEWHPGARIAAGQWHSVAWRFERDSMVRVQEWEAGSDLLIRRGREMAEASVVPAGASPGGRGTERVRLVRRGTSCP